MGILDAFAAEDRVDVKFSTFYELVKAARWSTRLEEGCDNV